MTNSTLLSNVQIHLHIGRLNDCPQRQWADLPDPAQRLLTAWRSTSRPEVLDAPLFEQLGELAQLSPFETALGVASLIAQGFVKSVKTVRMVPTRQTAA